MRSSLFTVFLLVLCALAAPLAGCDWLGGGEDSAQDLYYYSDNRKIPLELSQQWKVVQIPDIAQAALTDALSEQPDVRLRSALDPERGFYWLEAKAQQALDPAVIEQLAQRVPIRRTIPAFFRTSHGDTTHFVMTDEFNVKFRSGVSRDEIDAFNEKHGVEVAPFESEIDERQARDYNVYLLRVAEDAERNALEVANLYYENPLTVWSLPNFYVNYRLENRSSAKSRFSNRSVMK